jgi:hypothetical protein
MFIFNLFCSLLKKSDNMKMLIRRKDICFVFSPIYFSQQDESKKQPLSNFSHQMKLFDLKFDHFGC